MTANTTDFKNALRDIFIKCTKLGLVAIEVNSGNLHRRIGGYPGQGHRMPICCDVMRSEMKNTDSVISEPKKGKGASLTIRYLLPR